jgi:hypothetical protein
LSRQIPICPEWTIECKVHGSCQTVTENLGAVRGIVTAIYSIAPAALAFAVRSLSESALWPLFHGQQLSLDQIENYIEASRGTIPAFPFALVAVRNLDALFVPLGTILVTLTPLAAALIAGQVFNRHYILVEVKSAAQAGGGIEPIWQQTNPPSLLRENSAAFYTS